MNKEGRFIIGMLEEQIYRLRQNVINALKALMPNKGDKIEIPKEYRSEDDTFIDYDGKEYIFAGFKRHTLGFSLLGIADGKKYEIPPYNRPMYSIFQALSYYENALSRQFPENEEEDENDNY